MLVAANGSTRHHAFWADSREDEAHLFRQFLQCLSHCGNAQLVYYGSYAAHVFRRILASVSLDKISEVLWTNATNVLSLLYASIYCPTYSNELKAIGKYLGCAWSSPDATKLHTLIWRAQ